MRTGAKRYRINGHEVLSTLIRMSRRLTVLAVYRAIAGILLRRGLAHCKGLLRGCLRLHLGRRLHAAVNAFVTRIKGRRPCKGSTAC